MRNEVKELENGLGYLKTPGLFIVLLGPDGCGKTTLAHRLIHRWKENALDVFHFHWRPNLVPQLRRRRDVHGTGPVTSPPPNDFKYGYAVSLARYLYYMVDFIVGYWVLIYPRRRRGVMVIGERWYFDVLIHPERYAFRLPMWLLNLGGRFVPTPDITLLLCADPKAIHTRKPELTVDQIDDQLGRMRALLPSVPRGISISTDGPIDVSLRNIDSVVTQTRTHRNVRHGYWAYPSIHNVKLWIGHGDSLSNAFNLYHPYSRLGKIAKTAARVMPGRSYQWIFRSAAGGADQALLKDLANTIREVLDNPELRVSFLVGTHGPHQKITAQASDKRGTKVYVKIGSRGEVINLLHHEADVLQQLEGDRFTGAVVPRVLALEQRESEHMLFISAPTQRTRHTMPHLTGRDTVFLSKFAVRNIQTWPMDAVMTSLNLEALSSRLCKRDSITDQRLKTAIGIIQAELTVPGIRMTPCHGDYAPWNTLRLDDGSLYVFDWEYAENHAPALFDLIHRVFMPSWLVDRQSAVKTVQRLRALWKNPLVEPLLHALDIPCRYADAYILLYIMKQASWQARAPNRVPGYLLQCIDAVLSRFPSTNAPR